MSLASYAGISFSYDQMIKDVRQMIALASGFLQPESVGVLQVLISQIESVRNAGCDRAHFFGIDGKRPIKTILTGAYRDSVQGQDTRVHGSLSFVWEIRNRDKGRRTQTTFDILSNARSALRRGGV